MANEASVLPPGTVNHGGALPSGQITVTIEEVQPHGSTQLARCLYPDGFVKHHQFLSIEDLLPQIVRQLRGRHGVTEVKNIELPAEVKAGAVIVQEV